MATKTLRVWAHWTDAAGTVLFPSADFGAYPTPPGGVPTNTVLGWPSPPTIPAGPTGTPVIVWFEVTKQSDIQNARWFGPLWPGGPSGNPFYPEPHAFTFQYHPDWGDEGYDHLATGFKVNSIKLFLDGRVLNGEFIFNIIAPGGLNFPVTWPLGSSDSSPITPLFDGTGIWAIEIDRAPSSNVSFPNLLESNGIPEPYIIPLFGIPEGILGVEIEGEEIFTTTTTTPPPCNLSIQNITIQEGQCDAAGNRIITATVLTSGGPITSYAWKWDNGPLSTVGVPTSTSPPFAGGSGHTVMVHVSDINNPGCFDFFSIPFTVTSCLGTSTTTPPPTTTTTTTPPLCNLAITHIDFNETDCDTAGNRTVTATAITSGGPINSYAWSWDGGTTKYTLGPTSLPEYFAGGTTHTVLLTILRDITCIAQLPVVSYTVGACPGIITTTPPPATTTTTTPIPTPTTTTTAFPIVTTTTPPPTTTTTTTPTTVTTAPPKKIDLGCLCIILLIVAIGFIAAGIASWILAVIGLALLMWWLCCCAKIIECCTLLLIASLVFITVSVIAFLIWGCSGLSNLPLLGIAIGAAVIGLGLLIWWIFCCAKTKCSTLFVLIDVFIALAALAPIAAIILALLKLGGCGIGALVDWGVFGSALAFLYWFGRKVGCIIQKA